MKKSRTTSRCSRCVFRDKLELPRSPTRPRSTRRLPPYYHPGPRLRRDPVPSGAPGTGWAVRLPERVGLRTRRPLDLPEESDLYDGISPRAPGRRCEVSTTMVFVRLAPLSAEAIEGIGEPRGPDHPGRGADLRDGVPVPGVQDLRGPSASSTSRSTGTCCCCRTPRARTARSSRRESPRRVRWPRSPPPATSYAYYGVSR